MDMIKSKKGKAKIVGSVPEIIADLTVMLKAVRRCIPDADKWIQIAVEDSKKSSADIKSEVEALKAKKGGAVNGTE
jgi:hypothetical protein